MTHWGPIRYVVGYSGDRRGRDAVRLGVAMARDIGAELDLVLVLRTDDPYQQVYPPVGDISDLLRDQAQQWLRDGAALVPAAITARTHLREAQSVSAGLTGAATEFGAAMIIVGAGTSGGRFRMGSVANALLHSSPVPVALAPRKYSGNKPLTRLYVAVGTRPGAHQVINEALEAIERSELEMELISFVEGEAADPETSARTRSVEDHLRAAAAIAGRSRPVTVRVAAGSTLKQAAKDVDWAPGGLLVIGSSRLAQGRQTFLGTTAARLLRHLPVPMVVVPRPAPDEDGDGTDKATSP